MERLLHYTWRHRLLPPPPLRLVDGRTVDVLATGVYNSSDSGPDFLHAQIRLDGITLAGDIEIHTRASDWYRHRHDQDKAYDAVVLHVVAEADIDVQTTDGRTLPTLVVPVAAGLEECYEALLAEERYPPCYKVIPRLPAVKVHAWLNTLHTERLTRKTADITERLAALDGSWDEAAFATLARCYGTGINSDAFDLWARQRPLPAAAHHRDNLMQVEAIFLGTAGLLDKSDDQHRQEFTYLQRKFRLPVLPRQQWRYLRTRPQNFPHVRLLQLARMYHEGRTTLAALLDCHTTGDIARLYHATGAMALLTAVNAAVPLLFAYGTAQADDTLTDRALAMLDALPPENNATVRMWHDCGLHARSAADTQALLQLKQRYCDRRDCLRCRFGFEFLNSEYRQRFLHDE